eukprot:scaffold3692_cov178-Chaetoceros_neogracile.AAC.9
MFTFVSLIVRIGIGEGALILVVGILIESEEHISTRVLSGLTFTGRPPPASGPTFIVIVSVNAPYFEDDS